MAQSSKFKAWLSAARLRTLPLSISGIIVGSAYSYYYSVHIIDTTLKEAIPKDRILLITALALLTTLGFQVLSNFANDYGDGTKGTDNDQRVGPMRAIQSGEITATQMKKAVIITALVSFICAITLISVSFSLEQLIPIILFIALGIAAIWAAIKYTVGDNAYGYSGLGDLFVFVFFGPVSVMGVFYLITQTLFLWLLLPSFTIGLLSVAVLNLNNMRDVVNDQISGKNTIVVKIGLAKAKVFHYTVIIVAIIAAIAVQSFNYLQLIDLEDKLEPWLFLPSIAFIPIAIHLKKVASTKDPVLLDPELKKVALSTFAHAIFTILIMMYIF